MSSGSGIRAKKLVKLSGDTVQQLRRYLDASDLTSHRHGVLTWKEIAGAVVAFPKAQEQKEADIPRASDELPLDEIAVKLGLTYEEAIGALVRAKHKPPEAP